MCNKKNDELKKIAFIEVFLRHLEDPNTELFVIDGNLIFKNNFNLFFF